MSVYRNLAPNKESAWFHGEDVRVPCRTYCPMQQCLITARHISTTVRGLWDCKLSVYVCTFMLCVCDWIVTTGTWVTRSSLSLRIVDLPWVQAYAYHGDYVLASTMSSSYLSPLTLVCFHCYNLCSCQNIVLALKTIMQFGFVGVTLSTVDQVFGPWTRVCNYMLAGREVSTGLLMFIGSPHLCICIGPNCWPHCVTSLDIASSHST